MITKAELRLYEEWAECVFNHGIPPSDKARRLLKSYRQAMEKLERTTEALDQALTELAGYAPSEVVRTLDEVHEKAKAVLQKYKGEGDE